MDMHFPTSVEPAPPLSIVERGRARHDARWHACGYDREAIVAAELTEARDILAGCMDQLVVAGLRSEWPGQGIGIEDILADVGELLGQVTRQLARLPGTFADLAREYDGGDADDRRDARIGDAMVFGRSDW